MVLSCICDDDVQVRIFVQYLLNPTVIATLLWLIAPLSIALVILVITQVPRS